MTSRVILQPALVLHTRAFRDTSLLVDLLTAQHGRLTVLARGARGARSKLRGILSPFVPLVVSWSGKTDLPTVTKVEAISIGYNLTGKALLSGFYLNELLTRLLQRHDAHPLIYAAYQQTLINLQNNSEPELVLRQFEKVLLQDLGYGLELAQDINNQPINSEDFYIFEFGYGLIKATTAQHGRSNVFPGASLLALQHNDLATANALADAKRLLRLAIGALLDNRPLRSRELFLT